VLRDRRLLLGGLVSCAVLAVAVVDFVRTADRIPATPTWRCDPSDSGCVDRTNARFEAVARKSQRIEEDYGRRAWLYGAAIAVAALASTGLLLLGARSAPERRRLGRNLGTAGVGIGLLTLVALLLADPDELTEAATDPAFLPSGAILLVAVVASLTTLGQAPIRPEQASKPERAGRWVAIAALAFTGLTVVLAVIDIQPRPSCGGAESEAAPEWADALIPFVSVSAIAAIALGLAALLFRRWLTALASLVVTSLAYILMIGSTCAFY
jgi:hypothetical protein